MPKIIKIGKVSYLYDKTLWEILGNLNNFGIGRLITQGSLKRYPEPSFYKIVKVETVAVAAKKSRRVIAWVEKIFRGKRYPYLIELFENSYKPDFCLIPKNEEEMWYKRLAECKPYEKLIDPYISVPPLLKIILNEEKKAKGEPVEEDMKIKLTIRENLQNVARLAEDGETPTHKVEMGFGTPASPQLYENIDAARPLFVGREDWEDFRKHIQKTYWA